MAKPVFITILLLVQLYFTASAQRIRQSLNDFWQFAEKGSTEFQAAVVPGNIYYDLYSHGVISHPLKGTTENDIQWVSTKDWVYQTTFIPNPTLASRA